MNAQSIDGNELLLPTLIDKVAREEPDKVFSILLKSDDIRDGYSTITYRDFANAVNKCAWWLENTLGKGTNFSTIGYFGPPDIRYGIMVLAASKTKYKALCLLARNSVEGLLHLLDSTDCHIIVTAKDLPPVLSPLVSALATKRELQLLSLENIDYFFAKEQVPEYHFHATLEKNGDWPFAIVSTSGSTGLPNPVTYNLGSLTTYRRWLDPTNLIPSSPPTTANQYKNKCGFLGFPVSTMSGLIVLTAINVYWNAPSILLPGTVVPTPAIIADIHSLDICQASYLPPSVLEMLAKTPEHLSGLSKLSHIIWLGSPFSSSAIAAKICSYVPIYAAYGTAEAGSLPLTLKPPEQHEYIKFSPIVGGQFRHHSDDLYELIIVRDPKLKASQNVFWVFPELNEWATKDLWSKHPTEKDLWRYEGRTDDMIVLLFGHNVAPALYEGVLMSHPKINAALLVGTGRNECAWLIEAKESPQNAEETSSLIEEIWPTVEKANTVGFSGARVSRDKIMFIKKDKPMMRSAVKGTVQRKLTLVAYSEELDTLYG